MPNTTPVPNLRGWLTVIAVTAVAFVIVALLGFPAWGALAVFAVMVVTALVYVAIVNRRRRR